MPDPDPTAPPFDYAALPFAVRPDIVAAHRRAWERLARPGTWWTGEERVAIAAEARAARTCRLCAERKQAVSQAAAEGEHDSVVGERLPASAIELIHRLVNDAARLSRRFYEQTLASGLGDGRWVETVGVVVGLVSIDAFHRGVGLPPEPLPSPGAGAPSRYRPPQAAVDAGWPPMIPTRGAGPDELDLWGRGPTGNVIRALSLVPDEVRGLKDLSSVHYLPDSAIADPTARMPALARPQVELVAGRVSALNECFY